MSNRKKYLFISMSGLGFLYPAIRLAHILQRNFAQVLFISTNEHTITLESQGIDHFPMQSGAHRFLDLHRWGLIENALSDIKVVDEVVNRYRPDVIVTSPLAMMSFILAERYKIPLVNIGLCEYLFPGINDSDEGKVWRINSFTDTYNACRSKLGLPVVDTNVLDSPLIGTKHLLRSVPDLNDDIVLPPKVEFVGDLYFEPSYINNSLKRFIHDTKSAGKRIVYIQMGRLFRDAGVWSRLFSILEKMDMNFIVDIGRADYSTTEARMNKNFFVSQFVPIGAIKNTIDFVICTCQTTTAISSIIHGKQILAIPHSADSIELAMRLEKKKLAMGIYDTDDITPEKINYYFQNLNNKNLEASILKYQKLFLSYSDDMIYQTISSI